MTNAVSQPSPTSTARQEDHRHALMHLPEPQFIADFAWSWSEAQRLHVLRPHWEEQSGITEAEINLRKQCDRTMECRAHARLAQSGTPLW